MVEFFKQTSSLIITRLLLLLYVAKGLSSLNLCEKWTILNRISKPCKGKPNSHACRGRELRLAGQISATVVAGGEGEPARKDQGTRGNLAGGDVQVGVDRSGCNDGDPRRRRWSLTTAVVFRRGGSPAVDQRWRNSSRGSRRFY
jgi:hypothetical protein